MARLRLMCGLAGSGKSTHARRLEDAGWLRFSIDRDAYALGFRAAPLPDDVARDIRARQRDEIATALDAGRDVVVDYSFWSRADRDDYRALGRAHGATVDVAYLRTPEDVVRDRLARRAAQHADDMHVPPDLLAAYVAGFEVPGPDETDVVVH